jgi:CBS domain-containing protein
VTVLDLRVEDVMRKEVVTIESDFSARYAARLMSSMHISSLVVLSNGKIAGILTERDLVERIVARGRDPDSVPVSDVMSQPVIIVGPNIPLEKAVMVMLKQNIKKLPVMGGSDKQELVGMLSLTDIAKLHPAIYARIKEFEQMETAPLKEEVDFYII